jgi:TolA-binding protein
MSTTTRLRNCRICIVLLSLAPWALAGRGGGDAGTGGTAAAGGTVALDPTAVEVLLNTARTAFNQGDFEVAAEKFREVIRLNPPRATVLPARYGLGLSLLQSPSPDYAGAAEALQTPADAANTFIDRPTALYHLGVAYRGQADVAQAATRPAVAPNRVDNLLRQAAAQFAAAAEAFGTQAPAPDGGAVELPVTTEWVARCRCDQAQVLIRLGQYAAAQTAVQAIANDANWVHSRYRGLALYYFGYATFPQRQYGPAARALAQLAPFDAPDYGPHAQFLLARTLHLAGDVPEAEAGYNSVIATFAKRRQEAAEALTARNSAALKLTPSQRQQLSELANGSPPDYVIRATYYLGMILYDRQNWPEAAAKLGECVSKSPSGPLVQDARLHLGICQVQTRQYAQAIDNLSRVTEPRLVEEATRWLAKAQAAQGTDPANSANRDRLLNQSLQNLRKVADMLAQAPAADKDAAQRRMVSIFETADVQRLLKRYAEAAETYAQVRAPAPPELIEHARHRRAVTLQLGGLYAQADEACRQFLADFPQSPLVPEVMARYAENALLAVDAGTVAPADPANRFAELLARFAEVTRRYPDSPAAILAVQARAYALYDQGQYAQAAALLADIPETNRLGELGSVSLLEGDALFRTLPIAGDDALSTNRRLKHIEKAIGLLSAFVQSQSGQPRPEAPLAYAQISCLYRYQAELLADRAERQAAQTMFRRMIQEEVFRYPGTPAYAIGLYELARYQLLIGSATQAEQQLNRLQQSYANSPVAPLAQILQGEALRAGRGAAQAAEYLLKVRNEREAAMLKDPGQMEYVPYLRATLAQALTDAGRGAEAVPLYRSILADFPRSREAAQATLQLGRALRTQGAMDLATARRLQQTGSTPEARQSAGARSEAAVAMLREAATLLQKEGTRALEADALNNAAQCFYEAAQAWRPLAELEFETARAQAFEQLRAADPARAPASATALPPAQIPRQPAERSLRQCYSSLLDNCPDSPLVGVARMELAELCLQRDDVDLATRLLAAAAEGTDDAADRARLKLATLYLERGDAPRAAQQFQAAVDVLARRLNDNQTNTAANRNNLSLVAAYCRAGLAEAQYQMKDWQAVVRTLEPVVVTTQNNTNVAGILQGLLGIQIEPARGGGGGGGGNNNAANNIFRLNTSPIADRAAYHLAVAYMNLGRGSDARSLLSNFTARFPNSPYAQRARFLYAQACEQAKAYELAAAVYLELGRRTAGELAARSWLAAGLCQVAMDRPTEALASFLSCAYGYDYPEITGQALLEAARLSLQDGHMDKGRGYLERLVSQQPESALAQAARQQLEKLQ